MDQIYLGTWCNKEEKCIRAFFSWYFKNSISKKELFPQNLTNDQWFEKFKEFHDGEWQRIKNSYEN